ncbi:serine/threonine-protein phosphatase 7 long form protein [Trifolium repens]|nr:serine/threonine-protein phosphatase 7 long form protein [Trifolium repens]
MWKEVGIFEAIMNTKCRIKKDQNLLFGVVEKWCCETNTFVFPFGEATITLEDVMVLGGYPVIGDPVFAPLEDQEMKEVEKELILARQQLYKSKQAKARTTIWMDVFIDKGNELEHEAFLATWLSIFVFPYKSYVVNSSLFPIAIHLARGNPIALAPAILASIYKDLCLFKKTLVGLSKYSVGGEGFPMDVTLQSPFYLVQIWVWERFKNLRPQPMLIDHGDPLMFRWHKVDDWKADNVRLALDSAVDDFLWRPYVRYADKCGLYYPNDEIWIPYKTDLDDKMRSFVICLRGSELVGFDSIEQYLPHRVSMQFGMDQDVPSYVPRFNKSKSIAWKSYCRPISDKKLYFPPRLFEADVTARYAKWWKKSVLDCNNFVKKVVRQKRNASSKIHRPCAGKSNRSGNDVSGSKSKTRKVDDFHADVPNENSVSNCLIADENIDVNGSKEAMMKISETQGENRRYALRSKVSLSNKGSVVQHDLQFKKQSLDVNGSKEAMMKISETQGENRRYALRSKVSLSNKGSVVQHDLQFHLDAAARAKAKRPVEERDDDDVMVLLKDKYLKNQEELTRLAKEQEEILRLMALREKRNEDSSSSSLVF